jgi:hypothetical protein
MCKRDLLFFVSGFVWTYDPRKASGSTLLPFIPYPFQCDAMLKLHRAIMDDKARKHVVWEKSRDLGATWQIMIVYTHLFLFEDAVDLLVGSRKEEYVDKAGDKKCLFWKADFIIENLPDCLRPPIRRNKLIIENLANRSTITGESANPEFGRGDRKLSCFLDEFPFCEHDEAVLSATDDTTNCRILVGTPAGNNNSFARERRNNENLVITTHWSEHPEKAYGLYRVDLDDRGMPFCTVSDVAWHSLNPDYPFVMEPGGGVGRFKGLRSPWYDEQCRKRSRIRVRRELDIDYMAGQGQFADPAKIARYIQDICRPAMQIGELVYVTEGADLAVKEFFKTDHGRLRLWCDMDAGRPVKDEYVIGGDPSMGAGASNSVWTIANKRTRTVVGEYVNPNVKPHKFGEIGVALAKWFHDAYLIWESNGHGYAVSSRITDDLGYDNVYMRRREDSLGKRESDVPGFHTTPETKMELLGDYLQGLESRSFTNPSHDSVEEILEYVIQDGSVEHSGAINAMDPAGAKKNHGDRAISAALAHKACTIGHVENEDGEDEDEDVLIPLGIVGTTYTARREAFTRGLVEVGSW